jgi:hypothetical protein
VHFDQPLHKRQPYPQSTLRLLERMLDLREHIENRRQGFRRNADARITHRHDHFVGILRCAKPDVPAAIHVFRRIVQKIRQHLRKPGGVGVEVDRLRRQGNGQLVAGCLDRRTRSVERAIDRRGELDAFLAQGQLSPADATYVEQVVDDPDHLSELALHHCARMLDRASIACFEPHDLQRVADRRQWIAQLVRERGEKFVLAAIRFLQPLDQVHGVVGDGDITKDSAQEFNLVGVESILLSARE